jgi:hypothetical protein
MKGLKRQVTQAFIILRTKLPLKPLNTKSENLPTAPGKINLYP